MLENFESLSYGDAGCLESLRQGWFPGKTYAWRKFAPVDVFAQLMGHIFIASARWGFLQRLPTYLAASARLANHQALTLQLSQSLPYRTSCHAVPTDEVGFRREHASWRWVSSTDTGANVFGNANVGGRVLHLTHCAPLAAAQCSLG